MVIQHVDLQQFKAKVDVYKFLENRRVESITCLLNLYKTLDTKSDQPFQFQSINLKDDVIKQTLIRMPLVFFKFFTNIITTSEIITLLKSGGSLLFYLSYPLYGLIWIANKLKFLWFDLWYAIALMSFGKIL